MTAFNELAQEAASAAGFDLAGVTPIRQDEDFERFAGWVDAGRAGEMEYLKKRDNAGNLKRATPGSVYPWAKSAIVCAINYNTSPPYSTGRRASDRGWISRYAWGDDYHDEVMNRLVLVEAAIVKAFPQARTRRYVDTGPLLERAFAKMAGIGWVGKNACLINQQKGSWLFLGVVLTSLEIGPTLPAPDRCGSCTRCIEACPTDAITAPHQIDARRCISYLTIELRGPIPGELRQGVGTHVYGCDICQDVCPWNAKAPVNDIPAFQPRPRAFAPDLEGLAVMTEEEFRARFRGSAMRRTKRSGLRRNAVMAMGNSGSIAFKPTLEKLAKDEDPVVAEAAGWSLRRLYS